MLPKSVLLAIHPLSRERALLVSLLRSRLETHPYIFTIGSAANLCSQRYSTLKRNYITTLAPSHYPYLALYIAAMAILSHERSFHSHIGVRGGAHQTIPSSRIFFCEKELERGVRFLGRKEPCNTRDYASLIYKF